MGVVCVYKKYIYNKIQSFYIKKCAYSYSVVWMTRVSSLQMIPFSIYFIYIYFRNSFKHIDSPKTSVALHGQVREEFMVSLRSDKFSHVKF